MAKWTIAVVMVLITVIGCWLIFSRTSFDADKVAQAETRMWQAYYAGNRYQLGLELISKSPIIKRFRGKRELLHCERQSRAGIIN